MLRPKTISILVLLLMVVAILPSVAPVHAAITVSNKSKECGPCSTVTSPAQAITSGDLIVFSGMWVCTASCPLTVLSVTDSASPTDTFTLVDTQSVVSGGSTYQVAMYYAVASKTGSFTGTFQISNTAAILDIEFIDVSDTVDPIYLFASGKGSGTSAAPATSSVAFDGAGTGTVFFVGSIVSEDNFCTNANPGAPGANFVCTGASPAQTWAGQHSTSTLVTSPTTFPATLFSSVKWAEVGAVFTESPQSSVTSIVSCNYFQLQCWWYPLLFMMLYSGIILMVAATLKINSRGKAHLFFSALTFGSTVAVILGIMNITLPLLMIVLNTIFVLRVGR